MRYISTYSAPTLGGHKWSDSQTESPRNLLSWRTGRLQRRSGRCGEEKMFYPCWELKKSPSVSNVEPIRYTDYSLLDAAIAEHIWKDEHVVSCY
jgi:hypothetical protein